MVIFLLVFAITLGALAFGGYKLSKAATAIWNLIQTILLKQILMMVLPLILMLKPKNYYGNNYPYNFIKNTCINVGKCNIIIL